MKWIIGSIMVLLLFGCKTESQSYNNQSSNNTVNQAIKAKPNSAKEPAKPTVHTELRPYLIDLSKLMYDLKWEQILDLVDPFHYKSQTDLGMDDEQYLAELFMLKPNVPTSIESKQGITFKYFETVDKVTFTNSRLESEEYLVEGYIVSKKGRRFNFSFYLIPFDDTYIITGAMG